MVTCSPPVVSVFSVELTDAVVVNDRLAKSTEPVFNTVSTRCTVSPGASPLAATLMRFAVPDADMAKVNAPDPALCDWVDADVKTAEAPCPNRANADNISTTAVRIRRNASEK